MTTEEIEAIAKAFLEAPGYYGIITSEHRVGAVLGVATTIVQTALLRELLDYAVKLNDQPTIDFIDAFAVSRGLDIGSG